MDPAEIETTLLTERGGQREANEGKGQEDLVS
jgi:hypothetical protein